MAFFFPIDVFVFGAKSAWDEYKRNMFQKKHGSFVLEHITTGSKQEKSLINVLINRWGESK